MDKATVRATIIFPKELWNAFMLQSRQKDIRASKRIRDLVRVELGKPKKET